MSQGKSPIKAHRTYFTYKSAFDMIHHLRLPPVTNLTFSVLSNTQQYLEKSTFIGVSILYIVS